MSHLALGGCGNSGRFTPSHLPGLKVWMKPELGTSSNGAAQFVNAGNDFLNRSSNATLQTGDIDFTFAAWVYLDSDTLGVVLSKWGGTQDEYFLRYNGSSDRFDFGVVATAALTTREASTLGAPATSTWYFLVGWHDSVNNTLNIQVNNGTVDSTSYSAGCNASNGQFRMGCLASGTQSFDGRIDGVGFWKRVLTTAERTALYNAGSGTRYTALSTADKVSLVSFWELDEPAGTRYDAHGTNDLTDNNTVSAAVGVSTGDPVNQSGLIQWNDLSGNSNHMTQTTRVKCPKYRTNIINSLPAIEFVSTNQSWFSLPDCLSSFTSGEIFIVRKINNDPPAGGAAAGLWIMDGASTECLVPNTDGVIYDAWGSTTRKTTSDYGTSLTNPHIYNVSSATNKWTIRIDGVEFFDTTSNTVGFTTAPRLGDSSGGKFYDGYIAEVIIYNTVLTAPQRTKVVDYLAERYGI